ncbi:MAG: F0F1 ATP synthase subunit A, partial [Myxococcota bacterium]
LQDLLNFTVVFDKKLLPPNAEINTIHHLVASACVVLFLFVLSGVARWQLRHKSQVLVPSQRLTVLTFFELFVENLSGVMRDIIGPDYRRHVPFVATLGLYILFSNLLGLVPGFLPPTDSLNTTLACGLAVFVYFNYQGFRVHGMGHVTHLANPLGAWWGWFLSPLFFPVELVGIIVRPFSLAVRLAGNMIGDHKVLLTFLGFLPILLPLPFFATGLLISIIQTFVFCLLTCVYISLHTQPLEHA